MNGFEEKMSDVEAENDRLLVQLKRLAEDLKKSEPGRIGGWAGVVLEQDTTDRVMRERHAMLHQRLGRMLLEAIDDYWTEEERNAKLATALIAARDVERVLDADRVWEIASRQAFREELVKLRAPDLVTDRMLEVAVADVVTDQNRKLARHAFNAFLDAVGASTPGDRDDAPEAP